ncbi:TetR/AcrR family transcriptional regulator [Streptomyces flavochromogenes]|uniref:TetR/AcrR family transcriptional regulator n=1 Tax=Streptomyces flavochromogenes TaxID=68199 RepID=UPI0004C02568|nr:TetR/AcrR family transcriptional regulator [Streptomyces flavochromogenes]
MAGAERALPKARRLPRAVRERQMVDAAVRCFARNGYQAASMDEIAESAGVSKPLVYLYLNSKEELFTAVIRREAQALLGGVAEAVVDRSAPPDERLWAGLMAFFTFAAEHPDSWAVLSRQARTQGEPFAGEAARMRDEITAFVSGLIGEAALEAPGGAGITGRDVDALAQALVGSAESLASWANETPGVTAKEAAATLMNFAWSGLGNLMKSERWSPR